MTEYELLSQAFQKAAAKKGYCFDVDDVGRYEDHHLQECWEVFSLVNFKELNKELNALSK